MPASFWIALVVCSALGFLAARRHARRQAQTPPSAPRKLYNVSALPPMRPMPDDEALGLIRKDARACMVKPCAHHDLPRAVMYRIFGYDIIFPIPSRCPDCMQTLLETLSERCAACGLGIPPSSHVAIAWIGAPHPFTHVKCAEAQTLMCGMWGWGQLIPLSTLDERFNVGASTAIEDTLIDEAREREESQSEPDAGSDEDEEEETPPHGTPKPDAN